MSSTSPSPNSPLPVSPPPTPAATVPPLQSNSPPPVPGSPPPLPSVPPPVSNSPPPVVSPPPTQSPPPPSPPMATPPTASPTPTSPPPPLSQRNAPPPLVTNPSPTLPPPSSPPPPVRSDPPTLPPPTVNTPPPSISSPPPPPQTPNDPPSPPAPTERPPSSPPPPPQTPNDPPSPPAPTERPPSSPSPRPPGSSPPPPSRSPNPPNTSPPPPRDSPPPPSSTPPRESPTFSPPPRPPGSSPPPPSRSPNPPSTSPPPPRGSPPPPSSTPPRESPTFSPPPPTTNFSAPTVPSRSPPVVPPPLNSPPGSSALPVSPPPRPTPSPSTVPVGNNNDTSSPNGIGTGGTVAIVVVVLLLLGVFGTALFCCWKRKKKGSAQNGGHIMPNSARSTESDSVFLKVRVDAPSNRCDSLNGGMGNSKSWFTYEELVEATNDFSAENILGKGGFGSVYKGSLVDGRVVAVKQLNIYGGQGEREFRSEVETISRIHHRHLVSLVGYCISDEKRLLVYEYVPNNTLYFHIHAEGQPVTDWAKRVKIAIGAARGLAYLHEDCHPRIIHRDIKSSNILLDNNFEARVADFGLAKLVAMDANTHISTRVMGTFGYMAPEYASSGKLTEKSDVYSFGVVLLELISGRKPVDTSQPLGEESLVEWARPLLSHAIEKEEFENLADPRLEGDYVDSEMFQMIQAAAACVRHSASKRPKMGQVVRAFDNMVTADLTNGMKLGESEIYNSAQQSAEIRLFQRMAFGSHEYSTDFFSQTQSSSGASEGNHINSRSQRS